MEAYQPLHQSSINQSNILKEYKSIYSLINCILISIIMTVILLLLLMKLTNKFILELGLIIIICNLLVFWISFKFGGSLLILKKAVYIPYSIRDGFLVHYNNLSEIFIRYDVENTNNLVTPRNICCFSNDNTFITIGIYRFLKIKDIEFTLKSILNNTHENIKISNVNTINTNNIELLHSILMNEKVLKRPSERSTFYGLIPSIIYLIITSLIFYLYKYQNIQIINLFLWNLILALALPVLIFSFIYPIYKKEKYESNNIHATLAVLSYLIYYQKKFNVDIVTQQIQDDVNKIRNSLGLSEI